MLNHVGMAAHHVLDRYYYMKMDVPIAGVGHQGAPAGSAPTRPAPCST